MTAGAPERDLSGRRILRSTAALVGGRNLIALARLVVVAMIVRSFGAETYGEYALLVTILTIAEWIVDFGTTDVFVRDICREPGREAALMRVLAAAKLMQVPAALALIAGILYALQYPPRIVAAGLVASVSLVFFGGTLLYRVAFRVHLVMEREMAAELLSVMLMIGLVALLAHTGGSLMALLGCVAASRAAYFAFSFAFGRSYFTPKLRRIDWKEVREVLKPAATIGTAGLLLVVYEALDVVLLSRMAATADVAYYSGAQKLAWPLLMALSAVGTTFYTVIASHWPHAQAQFEASCQRAFDVVVMLAAVPLCSILAGAEFFMGLLGKDLVAGAPALRLLAVLCVVKAISMTVGPVLYIVHAQALLLRLVALALVLKTLLLLAVAPEFGFVGAAAVGFVLEVAFAALTIHLAWKRTGYRVRWRTALLVCAIVTASAGAAFLGVSSSLLAALLAAALCTALMFVTGIVSRESLRSLLEKGR